MAYYISIQSIGYGNKVEWIESIEAGNKSAAVRKANKWLSDNVFRSDYDHVQKFSINPGKSEVWQLM